MGNRNTGKDTSDIPDDKYSKPMTYCISVKSSKGLNSVKVGNWDRCRNRTVFKAKLRSALFGKSTVWNIMYLVNP